MNLYELATQYQDALKTLDNLDLPAEVVSDTLEALTGELKEKCQNVAAYQQNLIATASAKREAAARLIAQAEALESRADSLIEYLDSNMQRSGITEITCPLFTVKYKKNPPSVSIIDDKLLDKRFIKTKVTESVDKIAIKKAIKDGEKVEGAELVSAQRLVIE